MSLKPGLRPYAFVKFDTFIQRTKRLYLDPRGAEASGKGTGVASGLEQLNEDLQDVTRIMTKNMEDLLWRGDSLDRMSTMSSSLRDESLKYRKAAKKINTDALIRKWAPVGLGGLLFFVFVYYRFCEWRLSTLASVNAFLRSLSSRSCRVIVRYTRSCSRAFMSFITFCNCWLIPFLRTTECSGERLRRQSRVCLVSISARKSRFSSLLCIS